MKSLKQLKAKRLLRKFEIEGTFKTELLDFGFEKRIFYREDKSVHIAIIKILEGEVEITLLTDTLGGCPQSQLLRMNQYLKIANDTYNNEVKLVPPDESNGNVRVQTKKSLSKVNAQLDFFIAISCLKVRALMFESAIHKIAEGKLLKKSDYPDEILDYEKQLVSEYNKTFLDKEIGKWKNL